MLLLHKLPGLLLRIGKRLPDIRTARVNDVRPRTSVTEGKKNNKAILRDIDAGSLHGLQKLPAGTAKGGLRGSQ